MGDESEDLRVAANAVLTEGVLRCVCYYLVLLRFVRVEYFRFTLLYPI